ncbi:MAG: ATP-binding cassette domain-containing protein [Chitinophagaceae bacterium]
MLLSLNGITFEFGSRILLENASWHIYENERIGLIGPNGTGKSTLLKILIGEYSVSSGEVIRSKNLQIGYFHQDLQSLESDESILQVAKGAFAKALALEAEIKQCEQDLQEEYNEKEAHRLADLIHEFEIAGGYEMDYKSAEVLEGLGFKTIDLSRSFKEFSGGWRMRVLLAKMILQHPEILLLDEPTNHLDLPSIEWIEKYLQGYEGTIVIISHDRYFIDKMVTKVVEIAQQTLHHYTGNYSFYEKEKAMRLEFQQREFENQQDYIKQQERFIERFKAKASKATQAQSLVKRLDRLDRIEAPISETAAIHFRFGIAQQPGKVISTFAKVSKAYGDIMILNEADAEINRQEKIALIGANGKGKSTVLRLIAQSEQFEGHIQGGHQVQPAFYAQHQLEALHGENTILDELNACGSGKTEMELRALMGCFLFRGDDVFKKIKILSGGEKARVALAKTIISKANFLLLDEPTNHLDIASVNMLIEAIQQYDGTVIFVSHDRHFIKQAATKIWEIIDGKIKEFNGPYDEYIIHTATLQKKQQQQSETKIEIVQAIQEAKAVKENTSAYKQQQKEEKKIKNAFAKAEENLKMHQEKLKQLEALLSSPETYADKDLFIKTEKEYTAMSDEVKKLQHVYENLFEQLLSLES